MKILIHFHNKYPIYKPSSHFVNNWVNDRPYNFRKRIPWSHNFRSTTVVIKIIAIAVPNKLNTFLNLLNYFQ